MISGNFEWKRVPKIESIFYFVSSSLHCATRLSATRLYWYRYAIVKRVFNWYGLIYIHLLWCLNRWWSEMAERELLGTLFESILLFDKISKHVPVWFSSYGYSFFIHIKLTNLKIKYQFLLHTCAYRPTDKISCCLNWMKYFYFLIRFSLISHWTQFWQFLSRIHWDRLRFHRQHEFVMRLSVSQS